MSFREWLADVISGGALTRLRQHNSLLAGLCRAYERDVTGKGLPGKDISCDTQDALHRAQGGLDSPKVRAGDIVAWVQEEGSWVVEDVAPSGKVTILPLDEHYHMWRVTVAADDVRLSDE